MIIIKTIKIPPFHWPDFVLCSESTQSHITPEMAMTVNPGLSQTGSIAVDTFKLLCAESNTGVWLLATSVRICWGH
jgi:hypothetical protein